jgi:hypothetical protein
LQFFGLVLTALVLVPAGAHLFELPNKIGLAKEQYCVVQGIDRGWALFGVVLIPAVAVILALTVALRRQVVPFRCALVALVCMAATLAIFSPGPIRPMSRLPTGPWRPKTGRRCGGNGNTRRRRMRCSPSSRCAR